MKWTKMIGAMTVAGVVLTVTAVAHANSGHGSAVKSARVRAYPQTSFRAMDRNRDRRIGRFEYRRAASERFARWMSQVDRNRDGFLIGAELRHARATSLVGLRGGLKGRKPVALWQLWSSHMRRASADFSRIDRNRNGFISRREWRRARRRAGIARVQPAPRRGIAVYPAPHGD